MTLALDIAVGALAAVALGQQAAFVIDRRHARKTDAEVRKFLAAHAAAAAPEALLAAPEWASARPRPPVSESARKAAQGSAGRVFDPDARPPQRRAHNQYGVPVSKQRAAELAAASGSNSAAAEPVTGSTA